MKTKKISGFTFTIFVFFLIYIIFNFGLYVSADPGIIFFNKWLIIESIGSSLFLLSWMSASGHLILPTTIFLHENDSYKFFNNNIDIILKSLLIVISIVLLIFVSYIAPNVFSNNWRESSLFVRIIFYLFAFILFAGSMMTLFDLIKKRKNMITIDSNLIYWKDIWSGDNFLKISDIEKVVVDKDEILFNTINSSVKLSFSEIHLSQFKDKFVNLLSEYIGDNKIETKSNNKIKH